MYPKTKIWQTFRINLIYTLFFSALIVLFLSSEHASAEIVKKIFNAENGRKFNYAYDLPSGYDSKIPAGVLVYFHGNASYKSLNDTNYEKQIYNIQTMAFVRNLVPVVIMSPDTLRSGDAAVRSWRSDLDGPAVRRLLLSNLDGNVNIDKRKIYLDGASQGTCFLDDFLRHYSDSLAGGVIGNCGCWAGLDRGLDLLRLKRDWRVWIGATKGDFLYESSWLGFDVFNYGYKLNVRSDFFKSGDHCTLYGTTLDSALNWITGVAEYPFEDTSTYGWTVVQDLGENARIGDVKWHPVSGFVATRVTHDQSTTTLFRSNDGYAWNTDVSIGQIVIDFDFLSDGTVVLINNHKMIYYLYNNGTLDSALILGGADSIGYPFKLQAVSSDDLLLWGKPTSFFTSGDKTGEPANGGWWRSTDGGINWIVEPKFPGTEPGIDLDLQQSLLPIGDKLLLSVKMGNVLKLFISSDGGKSWEQRNSPADSVKTIRTGGGVIVALSRSYNQFFVSRDTALTWTTVELDKSRYDLEVLPDGRILGENRSGVWSGDNGLTWNREPGLSSVSGLECAGSIEHGMVARSEEGWLFTYWDKKHPITIKHDKKNTGLSFIRKKSPVKIVSGRGGLELTSTQDCSVLLFDGRGVRLGKINLKKNQSIRKLVNSGIVLWKAINSDGVVDKGSTIVIAR